MIDRSLPEGAIRRCSFQHTEHCLPRTYSCPQGVVQVGLRPVSYVEVAVPRTIPLFGYGEE